MEDYILRQVVEICILYFFGILAIVARIWTRTKMIGIKGYDPDDWLVIGVAGMWTMAPFIGSFYVAVAKSRHTSELTYEQRKQMPPEEYHNWEYGSQMFLFGLVGYFFIIWTLKFNMLCFYRRVVRGLWSEALVKPVMALVLGSAVGIVFMLSLTCRPFQALWQVWPDPGPYCVPQNLVFFVTILTCNLLTDICIMIIPMPVVIYIKGSIWRRAGIYLCFTLGFFCMFAAVLRFVLIFRLKQTGDAAMWSMREDFVGIIIGQAPMLTPLFRRKFWVNAGYATGESSRRGGFGEHGQSHELSATSGSGSGGKNLSSNLSSNGAGGRRKPRDPYSITVLAESEEEIVPNSGNANGNSSGNANGGPGANSPHSAKALTDEAGSVSSKSASARASTGPAQPSDVILVERRFDIESAAAGPGTRPDRHYYGGWNEQFPRNSRQR